MERCTQIYLFTFFHTRIHMNFCTNLIYSELEKICRQYWQCFVG